MDDEPRRTTFFLVRHAHAPWSPDEMRPLSEAGRGAAGALADRLAGEGIDAIYTSPYRRAVETVAPLAARLGLPVREVDDLRERTLGSIGGATFDEAVAATWADFGFAHPGGEPNRTAQRRVVTVCRRLACEHPAGRVVLSTHGSLLVLLLHAFDPAMGLETWRSLAFPDVFVLRVDRSGETGTVERFPIGRLPADPGAGPARGGPPG